MKLYLELFHKQINAKSSFYAFHLENYHIYRNPLFLVSSTTGVTYIHKPNFEHIQVHVVSNVFTFIQDMGKYILMCMHIYMQLHSAFI